MEGLVKVLSNPRLTKCPIDLSMSCPNVATSNGGELVEKHATKEVNKG